MYQTPILFIIFNRPDTTQQVFNAIKIMQPKYLYVVADGPRLDKPDDIERCKQTRAIVEQVDWECQLQTLFRVENRGCGRGPAEAISWFFENVEEGIILEDDCLVNEDFFLFMQVMLDKYKNNDKIMQVAGTNFLEKWKDDKQPYFYSSFSHTWGWATWRRAWLLYDFELKNWSDPSVRKKLKEHLHTNKMFRRFVQIFDYTITKLDGITWWDFQWCYCLLTHGGLCIVPSVNLVTNIGIGSDSTHTHNPDDIGTPILKVGKIETPLTQDVLVVGDWEFDNKYYYISFDKRPNLINRIKKIIKKIICN